MNNKSFTLIEALIYIFVFSLILVLTVSFLVWIFNYNLQARERTDRLLNSNASLNFIVEKIRLSDSIYYPTTSESQLSLDINDSYIDFYFCQEMLCFKEELKEPIVLNSNIDYLKFQLIEKEGVIIELNELTTTIFLR